MARIEAEVISRVAGVEGFIKMRAQMLQKNNVARPVLDFDDFTQEGRIAALGKARRFDHSNGANFLTFAIRRIRGQMTDAALTASHASRVNGKWKESSIVVVSLEEINASPEERVADKIPSNQPGPDEITLLQETRNRIREIMQTLPERLRRVLEYQFYYELTGKEIGVLLGISESRVSQLRREALSLMREAMSPNSDGL